MVMLAGVDTHAGYGLIDWSKCKQAGIQFAWLKCTEGNKNYVDGQYANSVRGCTDNDIPHGAYHFAFPLPTDEKNHPGRSPEAQVERAYAGCNGLGSQQGELAHAVDAEWPAPQDAMPMWGVDRAFISAWLKSYCELATVKWNGRKPIIYTYPYWWKWLSEGADVSWASEYLLWYADYGWPQDGAPPDGWIPPHISWVSSTWSDWAVCQHSADGSKAIVPGINDRPHLPNAPQHRGAVDRNCIRSETMLLILRGLHEREDSDFDIKHPDVPLA